MDNTWSLRFISFERKPKYHSQWPCMWTVCSSYCVTSLVCPYSRRLATKLWKEMFLGCLETLKILFLLFAYISKNYSDVIASLLADIYLFEKQWVTEAQWIMGYFLSISRLHQLILSLHPSCSLWANHVQTFQTFSLPPVMRSVRTTINEWPAISTLDAWSSNHPASSSSSLCSTPHHHHQGPEAPGGNLSHIQSA